jgi:hypothetical protein
MLHNALQYSQILIAAQFLPIFAFDNISPTVSTRNLRCGRLKRQGQFKFKRERSLSIQNICAN